MTTTESLSPFSVVAKFANCPRCFAECSRHSIGQRRVRDMGGKVVVVRYSKHFCPTCQKHFSLGLPHLAKKHDRYSVDLKVEAVRLLRKGNTLGYIAEKLDIPVSTISEWSKADVAPTTA